MQGATKIGFVEARIVVKARLSAMPALNLAIKSALAGATSMQSAQRESDKCIEEPFSSTAN